MELPSETGKIPDRVLIARSREQAEIFRENMTPDGELLLVWAPEDHRPEALESLMQDMLPGEWLRLPEVCEEETLQMYRALSEKYVNRLGGLMLGSIGQLGMDWPVPVAAGPGIPVMNREAARFLREQGCVFVTASPELTGEEGKNLVSGAEDLPTVAFPVYGRTQLMLLHHCPARTAQGWQQGHSACALCDGEDSRALRGKSLEDEKGHCFPLQRIRLPEGCLVRLLNTLPTDLGDKPVPCPRVIELTTETAEETRVIRDHLLRNERSPGESTRGHWARPVL